MRVRTIPSDTQTTSRRAQSAIANGKTVSPNCYLAHNLAYLPVLQAWPSALKSELLLKSVRLRRSAGAKACLKHRLHAWASKELCSQGGPLEQVSVRQICVGCSLTKLHIRCFSRLPHSERSLRAHHASQLEYLVFVLAKLRGVSYRAQEDDNLLCRHALSCKDRRIDKENMLLRYHSFFQAYQRDMKLDGDSEKKGI